MPGQRRPAKRRRTQPAARGEAVEVAARSDASSAGALAPAGAARARRHRRRGSKGGDVQRAARGMALEVAAYDVAYVLEELVRRVEANVLAEEEMRFDGTFENLYILQHVAGQTGVFDAARAKLADGLYRDGMRHDPFHLRARWHLRVPHSRLAPCGCGCCCVARACEDPAGCYPAAECCHAHRLPAAGRSMATRDGEEGVSDLLMLAPPPRACDDGVGAPGVSLVEMFGGPDVPLAETSSDEEDYEPPPGAGPWPTYGPGRCCPLNVDRMLRPCNCRASHYACRHSRACSAGSCVCRLTFRAPLPRALAPVPPADPYGAAIAAAFAASLDL